MFLFIKKQYLCFLLLLICSLLAGCGFHFRTTAHFPANLKQLHLETPNRYSALSIELRDMLQAQGVKLVENPNEAPFTLQLTNVQYTHSSPPLTTTSTAVSYTYTLTVSVQLFDSHYHSIGGDAQFSNSQDLIVTNSQLFAPTATPMINAELRRNVINSIYY